MRTGTRFTPRGNKLVIMSAAHHRMPIPKQTSASPKRPWTGFRPGTYVDGFVGCFMNDRSSDVCGLDINDRSFPQVRQYWTHGGF